MSTPHTAGSSSLLLSLCDFLLKFCPTFTSTSDPSMTTHTSISTPNMPTPDQTLPPRPPLLPISATYIYKTVGNVSLAVDIYLPTHSLSSSQPSGAPLSISDHQPHPLALFIHGGGWVGGTRIDYCRPLFRRLLSANFIIASIDYRLLPETSLKEQLSDIKDVQPWLRTELPLHLAPQGFEVDVDTIVVIGGSAGGHLALFTPTFFSPPPKAILSLYGPTNMHSLPYIPGGRLHNLVIPPVTHELLETATDYVNPPTEVRLPEVPEDDLRPRSVMGLHVFRGEIIAEFLCGGLVRTRTPREGEREGEVGEEEEGDGGQEGMLSLPEKGSVPKEEIDAISPLSLLTSPTTPINYPPIFQVIGTADTVFSPSHVTEFHAALERAGVECKMQLVEGKAHAFDIWAVEGDEVDEGVVRGCVEWLVDVTSRKRGE